MGWGFLGDVHRSFKARAVRFFFAQEVIRTLRNAHSLELAQTPGEMWPQVRSHQLEEIQAVRGTPIY